MLLTNLCIVLPDRVLERGALRIEDGLIAAIIEGDPPARNGAIDGTGLTALPGIVDMHGDMLEREFEPRPGARFPIDMALFELDKRLAATGVTTSYAALSFWGLADDDSVRSAAVLHDMIRTVNRLRPELLTDFYIHARFEVSTPDVAPSLIEMLHAEQVHLVSLMDHTPGQGQYRNIDHYIDYIARWRKVDRSHVEVEVQERLEKVRSAPNPWDRAHEIAGLTTGQGLPLASHDDDTIEKIDLVASLGATMCEFPVTMEAARAARQRGMHVVMGAPNVLRGGSHSGNLSAREAIAAGVVDMLAADYYPAALLHAVFALAREGLLPLHEAARLVSYNPALALGLHDRGALEVGKSADLALVEDVARPRVRCTIRHGQSIYADRAMAHRTRA